MKIHLSVGSTYSGYSCQFILEDPQGWRLSVPFSAKNRRITELLSPHFEEVRQAAEDDRTRDQNLEDGEGNHIGAIGYGYAVRIFELDGDIAAELVKLKPTALDEADTTSEVGRHSA